MRSSSALWIALVVGILLLVVGLTASLIDIDNHGWGLYLVLVSVVIFIMLAAFCLVGTSQQSEPTIATKIWTRASTIRQDKIKKEPTVVINDKGKSSIATRHSINPLLLKTVSEEKDTNYNTNTDTKTPTDEVDSQSMTSGTETVGMLVKQGAEMAMRALEAANIARPKISLVLPVSDLPMIDDEDTECQYMV